MYSYYATLKLTVTDVPSLLSLALWWNGSCFSVYLVFFLVSFFHKHPTKIMIGNFLCPFSHEYYTLV